MKRLATIGAAIVALLVVIAAVAAAARAPRLREPVRIRVVERAISDTEVDTDGSGGTSDSEGDLLTFHNPIYDASNTDVVGRDLGECVLVVPGQAYDCTWTTFLPGGQIRVSGPFSFKKDTNLAITGGTGVFANADGSMFLHARNDGNFDFVFSVKP